MATIYPTQQYQQPQQPQPQAQASYQQDPLFEALVKYITSGPAPSSISANEVQSIIDSHLKVDGGREYLQAIVDPSVRFEEPRIYHHVTRNVSGFVSGNMTSMTLVFGYSAEGSISRTEFRGTINGFFGPFVYPIENCEFYWNDGLPMDTDVKFTVYSSISSGVLIFTFMDESGKVFAELNTGYSALKLPSGLQPEGTGRFTLGPQ